MTWVPTGDLRRDPLNHLPLPRADHERGRHDVRCGSGVHDVADPDAYAPAHCIVPKLKGKKLKIAKKKLTKADCKLGGVSGHKSKAAKVKKQSQARQGAGARRQGQRQAGQ